MPATDRYKDFGGAGLNSPFIGGQAVTPHDDNELTEVTRALWVGASGTLVVVTLEGVELSFANFGPGWLPGRVRKVKATGTTAASIVGVW